jgi:hypothetical protein
MTNTHSEYSTVRTLGGFVIGMAAAFAVGYGLLQLLGPVYYWGGNPCSGTDGVVATCGVLPLGMMLTILAFAVAVSWVLSRRPL